MPPIFLQQALAQYINPEFKAVPGKNYQLRVVNGNIQFTEEGPLLERLKEAFSQKNFPAPSGYAEARNQFITAFSAACTQFVQAKGIDSASEKVQSQVTQIIQQVEQSVKKGGERPLTTRAVQGYVKQAERQLEGLIQNREEDNTTQALLEKFSADLQKENQRSLEEKGRSIFYKNLDLGKKAWQGAKSA